MALLNTDQLGGNTFKAPCYERFKYHLADLGFSVFPFEFECIGSEHPYVDIAAKMGTMYWAFEYKSEGDSISRGVDQLRSYSDWFDYVVLVSERTLDHRRSEIYWDLKKLGAGVWNYNPGTGKRIESTNPTLQRPTSSNRRLVARRFRNVLLRRNTKIESEIAAGNQTLILEFV